MNIICKYFLFFLGITIGVSIYYLINSFSSSKQDKFKIGDSVKCALIGDSSSPPIIQELKIHEIIGKIYILRNTILYISTTEDFLYDRCSKLEK